MTSTVTSTLQPNTSLVELLRALFPCGSITGAPKIRTMEIIRELEPQPRGIYTGTIGLLQPGGDCVFNVAIRTVVVDAESGEATFGVGGGITIGSTAECEYDECLVKAKFLNCSPQTFDLFESILLENGRYFLLERHLKRLRSSAEFFNFEFPESKIVAELERLRSEHPNGKWKAKLTLANSGRVEASVLPIELTSQWRVGLANFPIDSSDRLLFHKTTQRDVYTSQLELRPDCDDLLFLNERGELTESSVANVVLNLGGKLVTPPVSAGLLAGTFRDQLVSDGEIEERTILVDDL
jgi:para-aminobenzoate synthetase/4-amino-4-deoxychorismate lyase